MKRFFYSITALLLLSFNIMAQQEVENKNEDMIITGFNGKIENNSLSLVWKVNTFGQHNYWEVQASKDGNLFSTIGLVMGEDPKSGGTFRYKHDMKSIRPGMKYFRVLHKEKGEWAMASKSIGISK